MKIELGPYDDNRKIDITIDKYDTWNLDHTLALIIHPCLIQLKKDKHGAPNVDDEDVPEYLKTTSAPPKENEWDIDDNWFKRWDWIMDEMIWTFGEFIKEDRESSFYDHSEVDESAGLETQIQQIKIDREGLDVYWKRIDNGLRLFGKYYRGLWD